MGPMDPHESLGYIQKMTFFLEKKMHWIKFNFPSRPHPEIKVGDTPANTLIDALNTSLPNSILVECGLSRDFNKPPHIKATNL